MPAACNTLPIVSLSRTATIYCTPCTPVMTKLLPLRPRDSALTRLAFIRMDCLELVFEGITALCKIESGIIIDQVDAFLGPRGTRNCIA